MLSLFLFGSLLALTNSCPLAGCDCDELTIYCKYKGLKNITVIKPSDQVYEQLTLSNNVITNIPARAFSGLRVKSIEILSNPLINISEQAFEGLEGTLEHLTLAGDQQNPIIPAPWTALQNLTLLKTLTLSYFNIPTIDDDVPLMPFVNLRVLRITQSPLRYLHSSSLQPANNTLAILDLSDNQFTTLPVAAIRGLGALTKIYLYNNGISVIRQNAFETNLKLEELHLSQNKINNLDPGCFNQITSSLTLLGLGTNNINGGQLQALQDLSTLQQLILGYNPIVSIPPGTFRNMANLGFLNLQQTQLMTLNASILQGLGASMYDLTLTDNFLSEIPTGTFSSMTNLRQLSLDSQGNGFAATLVPGVFQGLGRLETLTLENTPGFGSQANWNALKELASLTSLTLSTLQLTDLPNFAFSEMRRLETLDLSENSLTVITEEKFFGLRDSLKSLILRGNSISSFDQCTFDNFTQLNPEAIELASNPLQCDCELEWLSDWLHRRLNTSSDSDRFLIKMLTWTCSDGRRFIDIKPEDLGCLDNATKPECSNYYTTTIAPTTTETTTEEPTPEPTTPSPTTTTSTTTTTTPMPTTTLPSVMFVFNITNSTSSGLQLKWMISHQDEVEYFIVNYENLLTTRKESTPRIYYTYTAYKLQNLLPNSDYEVCLSVHYKRILPSVDTKCLRESTVPLPTVATTTEPEGLTGEQIAVIAGSVVGGVLLLVIIIIIIFILIRYRSQENKRPDTDVPSPWLRSGAPQEAYNSKRFIRNKKIGNQNHIKEIRHVQGDTNLQRTSAGSYQYLDTNVKNSPENGAPMGQINSFQQPLPKKNNNGLDTSDLYNKYYEIALDGVETHI